ncbi:MAG: YbaK/EbsC family protein [Clostridiales bacterium]|nr:YbaK/EbsC family protein [Clostridiales bacterium]
MGLETKYAKGTLKVKKALENLGYELIIKEMPESTRTAVEAANAIGCSLEQIVKSLVFMLKDSERPVMIIASGPNRVDEKLFNKLLGEKLVKADADFVLEHTGYSIGGVSPVGLKNHLDIYIDQDLMAYEEIWAAAGTPKSVFRLTPDILKEITGGKLVRVN